MDTRILLWDDGLDYVNYLDALNAVGLTAEVSREADTSCGGLVLPGGGSSPPLPRRRSPYWAFAGGCRR